MFGHLNTLYTGRLIDYIQDAKWPADGTVRRARDDSYMDVHLAVAGSSSVAHALRRYTSPEMMEGSNQWACDDAGTKVDALKARTGGTLTNARPALEIPLGNI